MKNCRLAERATAFVKTCFDKILPPKSNGNTEYGGWHAVCNRGYLVVFHLAPEEQAKINLYHRQGLTPFRYIACAGPIIERLRNNDSKAYKYLLLSRKMTKRPLMRNWNIPLLRWEVNC